MRPSAWRAIASPNSVAPKSTVAIPPAPKVDVEGAVGLEPRDLDVAPLGAREAAEQELAVRRHDHGRDAADGAPAEELAPVAVEARVERAVGLQAHDGGLQARVSGQDDPAVRLQRGAVDGLVVGAESRFTRLPPVPKVGSSVPLAARSARRRTSSPGPPPAGDDDPPVGLHEHGPRGVRAAEVDRLLPPLPKVASRSPAMPPDPTPPPRRRAGDARARRARGVAQAESAAMSVAPRRGPQPIARRRFTGRDPEEGHRASTRWSCSTT
jgi:hypothetical protein